MQQKRIIIHVGFCRTGSTLLQHEIFPRLIGDVRVITPASRDRRLIDLFEASYRNIQLTPVRKVEKQHVDDIVAEYPESTLLISDEGLFGEVSDNMLPLPHVTEEFRAFFGEPEILVIIRRQSDMVKSFYRLIVGNGFYNSFPKYVGFQNDRFAGFQRQGSYGRNVYPPGLNFFNFFTFLETSFGSGKVHVLPFEWVKQDFDRFCASISAIVGAKLPATNGPSPILNRGSHGADLVLLKALNRVWDTRIFGFPLLPMRPFIKCFDLEPRDDYRRKRGLALWLLRAAVSRICPLGVLQIISPVISPLINLGFSTFGISELQCEREIEKAIDEAVFESNVALNERLGGILTGLGYCDR
jgi:hypothetical protein